MGALYWVRVLWIKVVANAISWFLCCRILEPLQIFEPGACLYVLFPYVLLCFSCWWDEKLAYFRGNAMPFSYYRICNHVQDELIIALFMWFSCGDFSVGIKICSTQRRPSLHFHLISGSLNNYGVKIAGPMFICKCCKVPTAADVMYRFQPCVLYVS